MNAARERLEQYRRNRKPESSLPSPADVKELDENEGTEPKSEEKNLGKAPLRFYDFWAVDFLNFYPMRKWREFCAAFPLQCWIASGCVWMTGQLLFVKLEFGLVYFIFSLFIFMFLNLGVRKEGEMSAYSVFNPNCERLLGQITSEHFERDVLRRNQGNGEG